MAQMRLVQFKFPTHLFVLNCYEPMQTLEKLFLTNQNLFWFEIWRKIQKGQMIFGPSLNLTHYFSFSILREFWNQSDSLQKLSLVIYVLKLKSKNLTSLDSAWLKLFFKWNRFSYCTCCLMEFVKHCLAKGENYNFLFLIWPNKATFGDFHEELSHPATRRKKNKWKYVQFPTKIRKTILTSGFSRNKAEFNN